VRVGEKVRGGGAGEGWRNCCVMPAQGRSRSKREKRNVYPKYTKDVFFSQNNAPHNVTLVTLIHSCRKVTMARKHAALIYNII